MGFGFHRSSSQQFLGVGGGGLDFSADGLDDFNAYTNFSLQRSNFIDKIYAI